MDATVTPEEKLYSDTFQEVSGVLAHIHDVAEGTLLDKHVHDYDHMSVLARGTAVVTIVNPARTEEETHVMNAGEFIVIKAGYTHQIYAATDIIWYCIHPNKESI